MTTGAGWQTCVCDCWEICFPFLALCKGWCFGVGVQPSLPEPQLTLGALGAESCQQHFPWAKAGTAAAGMAEPVAFWGYLGEAEERATV